MKKGGGSEAAVFAAVLGLLSVVLPLVSFPFGVLFGSFIGIVLGVLAIVMGVKSGKQQKTPWTRTSITLGIIGIIVSALLLLWALAFLAALAAQVAELQQQGFFDNLEVSQAKLGASQ